MIDSLTRLSAPLKIERVLERYNRAFEPVMQFAASVTDFNRKKLY